MKKTYLKFLRRSVWRSKARFFSILAIVAIGVGFLGGLISTTPDMQLTMDRYFDENKLHDIDIKGPLGLTEDDIQAIGAIDGVESVTPAYVTDLIMENGDGSYVTRIYGMPQGKDTVNNFRLIEGRLPTTKTECLISVPNSYGMHFEVGHQLKISATNKDYDKIGDTYTFQELTVVGIVETPLFFSTTSEPSNVGSGKVQLVLFLPPDAYSME
ncbi:MAG: ABC transporter permease, partial [Oscillospiraceae bacterium]